MRHPAEFAEVIRSGQRARRDTVTVYFKRSSRHSQTDRDRVGPSDPHIGLVVSKAVGNSVARHRVSRRLRAQLAARVQALPHGVNVVVRANPSATECDSQRLGQDLDAAFARILRNETKDWNAT